MWTNPELLAQQEKGTDPSGNVKYRPAVDAEDLDTLGIFAGDPLHKAMEEVARQNGYIGDYDPSRFAQVLGQVGPAAYRALYSRLGLRIPQVLVNLRPIQLFVPPTDPDDKRTEVAKQFYYLLFVGDADYDEHVEYAEEDADGVEWIWQGPGEPDVAKGWYGGEYWPGMEYFAGDMDPVAARGGTPTFQN